MYKAKLTGNKRGVGTTTPNALLIDIVGFERNHCWIEITPAIAKLMPQGHRKPISIQFDADIKSYNKRAVTKQHTLNNITNINRVA